MPEHVEYSLCGHFKAAGGGFVPQRPPSVPGQRTLTSDPGAFTDCADGRMKTRAPTRTSSAPNSFKLGSGAAMEDKHYNIIYNSLL